MTLRPLSLVAVALATAAAGPVGPTAAEFTALRTAQGETCPPMRKLACAAAGDPTEFRCTYQERFKSKPWTTSVALVARDGKGWTWLDGGPRCSSLPQH